MFRNCMDIMSMNGKEIAIGKKSAAFSFLSPQGGMRHMRTPGQNYTLTVGSPTL